MYNLKNLNDYEYEVLCLDVMSKKLNKKLFRFTQGKDGGIDVCDKIDDPKIIIQVKQYSNSRYSNLKSVIQKEEIEKIKKLNPNDYYLCTSLELTRDNKKELYGILKPYMKDISNIIDGIEMDNFLEQEENIDIVKKNYKLWINATNVLSLINNKNVFIDCDELMYDIENQIVSFVETEGYVEAYNKLNKENIIIIIGGPGVGKSTISKMLLLKYASEGYKVRYTTDNNISDIKNVISMDKDSKEILLLDDFLGQHYLNLKESEPNELKSLLSFIRRNKNKKLILNSRITILKEAQNRYIKFNEIIEEYEENTYLINLDKMRKIEKAKIFYNHMFFNDIPKEHFLEIKKDKKYLKVVEHKNYNPRIIEYVTKKNRYKNIDAQEYYNFIMKNLNNPKDVWKDEFENRLSREDRKLMLILYSLTNSYIETNCFKEAYNYNIKNMPDIDSSLNVFERTLYRLSDSLIAKVEDNSCIKIGVLNPSINDYIKNELDSNNNEQINIVDNAVFIEQILKFLYNQEIKDKLNEKVISGKLLEMKTLKKSVFFYYTDIIFDNCILEKNIEKLVKIAFERSYENIISPQDKREYNDLITKVIKNHELIEFYNLKDILFDEYKMNCLLGKLDLYTLEYFMNNFADRYSDTGNIDEYENIIALFKKYIILEIEKEILREAEIEMDNLAYNILERTNREEIDDYINNLNDTITQKVNVQLSNFIYDKKMDMIDRFANYMIISEEEIDEQEIEESIDIDSYIESNIDYINRSDYDDETDVKYDNEEEEIKNIFEREKYENI